MYLLYGKGLCSQGLVAVFLRLGGTSMPPYVQSTSFVQQATSNKMESVISTEIAAWFRGRREGK